MHASEWEKHCSHVTSKMRDFARGFITPLSFETSQEVRLEGTGTYVAIDDPRYSTAVFTCQHVSNGKNLHYRFFESDDVFGWPSQSSWVEEAHPIDAAFAPISNFRTKSLHAKEVSARRFDQRHRTVANELIFFMGFAGENSNYGFDVHSCSASGYCSQEIRDSGDDQIFELFGSLKVLNSLMTHQPAEKGNTDTMIRAE